MTREQYDRIITTIEKDREGDGFEVCIATRGGDRLVGAVYAPTGGLVGFLTTPRPPYPTWVEIYSIVSIALLPS